MIEAFGMKNGSERRIAPGPKGLPLVGVMHKFAKDPLGYLIKIEAEYGEMARFYMGPHLAFMPTTSELVEEFFLNQHRSFVKDPGRRMISDQPVRILDRSTRLLQSTVRNRPSS